MIKPPDFDWEPPPGMTKLRCTHCRHLFASTGSSVCASCRVPSLNRAYRADQSVSPFEPGGGAGKRINPKGSVRS
jgi:hypothetical protein